MRWERTREGDERGGGKSSIVNSAVMWSGVPMPLVAGLGDRFVGGMLDIAAIGDCRVGCMRDWNRLSVSVVRCCSMVQFCSVL